MPFQKTIYVTIDKDGEDEYLVPWYEITGLQDGEEIGIYELKETKKVSVTVQLKD
jgi:hypothetical protein